MTDFIKDVRGLSVRIVEDNERVIEATIEFHTLVDQGNQPDDVWTINIPRIRQAQVERLIEEFQKTISQADDVVRDTVVNKDYTIRLQRRNSD